MEELRQVVKDAAKKLFDTDIEPELSRPDEQFGDYATNAALQLAKKAAASPHQIAEQLASHLNQAAGVQEVTVAGPGFINFRLTDEALAKAALFATDLPQSLAGQQILVEFGDPNPFKQMHIGHLYSSVVGDAIASLLEAYGADIKRLSYHGDVGLHVAKAIWGMRNDSGDIGAAYAAGAKAYEEDESTKPEIDSINQHVYKRDDEQVNKLYDEGRAQSLAKFGQIYEMLGIRYDKQYFESESSAAGLQFVNANRQAFAQSQGALVYEGEKVGLHTRVFITSKGLPTYETKDLGLAVLKDQDYPRAARSIIITANEQTEYFRVMLAALAEIDPNLAKKTTHLTHGFVNLSTGKMSSRTGDVYGAEDLINEVTQAAAQQFPESGQHDVTALAALKYDFLKPRLGGDITFDVKESVSLEGNSGPYLQYAYARARSILAKSQASSELTDMEFDKNERSLARKIGEYPEVLEKAVSELMPHHVAAYLYELAQKFNGFYENSRIIGDERQVLRLKLVGSYTQVLKSGLNVLNIEAPEKM